MHVFPEEYVYGVLFVYQKNYQKQFYNLCRVYCGIFWEMF